MRYLYTYLLVLLTSLSLYAQVPLSIDHVKDFSLSEINSILGQNGPYEVSLYKVVYTQPDHEGIIDTVSGVISVPLNPLTPTSLVVYCHGTTSGPDDAPSNLRGGYEATLAYSTFGFACSAPDYIGLGVSADRFHPYIHAETEALSGLHMIDLTYEFLDSMNYTIIPELFLTGYSQGGHASMALQKMIETSIPELTVTAAAHGSGPYSVSEVMREQIIADVAYPVGLGYVPYMILGQQSAYGDLYSDLTEVFKPNFVSPIEDFRNYDIGLSDMGLQIGQILLLSLQPLIPNRILQDSVLNQLIANDTSSRWIQVLREQDVYNFKALAPTRMYYCGMDEQVPFENALFADSAMNVLGAVDTEAIELDPDGDHGECAALAIPESILFFLSILEPSSTANISNESEVVVYPNPAQDRLYVSDIAADSEYRVFGIGGKIIDQGSLDHEGWIDVSQYTPGVYALRILNEEGASSVNFVKN